MLSSSPPNAALRSAGFLKPMRLASNASGTPPRMASPTKAGSGEPHPGRKKSCSAYAAQGIRESFNAVLPIVSTQEPRMIVLRAEENVNRSRAGNSVS